MNRLIKPYNNFNLTYRTTYNPPSVAGNELLLHVEYMSKEDSIPTPMPKEYFMEALNVPYLLKISNFTDTTTFSYTFGLDSFYRQFMSDSIAMSELSRFGYINGEIFVSSIFSDKIYLIDKKTLNIKRNFQVESEFTTVHSKPIELYKNADYQGYLDKEVRFGGYTQKIVFDNENNVYIVVVAWENKEKIIQSKSYSYLIYSEDGFKIDELPWDNTKYSASLIYYLNGKYYISSTSSEQFTKSKISYLSYIEDVRKHHYIIAKIASKATKNAIENLRKASISITYLDGNQIIKELADGTRVILGTIESGREISIEFKQMILQSGLNV